jgi:hypothetical protein
MQATNILNILVFHVIAATQPKPPHAQVTRALRHATFIAVRSFKPFGSDDEIAAIGRGLLDLTLPKTAWTHGAHFAAALWLLSCRKDLDAERDMPRFIRRYNEATGTVNSDTAGYHETITQASIRAARDFLMRNGDIGLFHSCNALMASALGDPDWPLAYWSRALLFSTAARRNWVDPDIRALPF